MASVTTAITGNVDGAALSSLTASGTRPNWQVAWMLCAEVLLDVLSVFAAVSLGFKIAAFYHASGDYLRPTYHVEMLALMFSCVMVLLLDRAGAYQTGGSLLRVKETACIVEAVCVATFVLAAFLVLLNASLWIRFVLLEAPFVCFVLLVQKSGCWMAWMFLRMKDGGGRRVVIYGRESSVRMLRAMMERSPRSGLVISGVVFDEENDTACPAERSRQQAIAVASSTTFGADFVRQCRAEMVVVASPISSRASIDRVIAESAAAGADVVFGAEAYSTGPTELQYIDLDGQMVYGHHVIRSSQIHAILSRVLDLILGSVLLVFAAIPMLLAAIAIRIETPGPILFKQKRIGYKGVPFTIYKFRSMHHACCVDSVSPADAADRRITRVGRFLRRTSMDELPQLFNVLRGEMALVGPRPEMAFIVAGYSQQQRQRLHAKPGLTGIWQISCDRRYPIHENIHYDLYYLKHRSISMDIAILIHTMLLAARGI